ncbi:MAG: AI-2E family transporter [Fimbriimonadaceae bacterium]|nr:AI-2E family transporter [Fimbriimonadaceae bacterium]
MGWWRIALWIALVIITVTFLYMVRMVLLPFILAFIIASLLDPSIKKLRMRGWSKGKAIMTPFLIFFGILGVVGFYLAPVIGGQLSNFSTQVEAISHQLTTEDPSLNFYVKWNPAVIAENKTRQSLTDQLLTQVEPILTTLGLPHTRQELYDRYIEPQQQEIAKGFEWFFTGILGVIGRLGSQLFLLIFTPLLAYFMLADMDRFKRRSAMWIPPSIRAETVELLQDIGSVFTNYLRGVTISISLYMVMMAIILTILQVPYGILLGILFGAIYLIPYIGPIISSIIMILTIGLSGNTTLYGIEFSSSWTLAMVSFAVYLVFDRGFDMLIYPRMVGRSVGLNPLVSMFVTFSGGALFGIIGMLLAFPVAGAVKVILDRLLKVTSSGQESLELPAVPLRHRATG